MSYRGKTENVREIGKALGVSTILEGSVRREGNKVRVTVQLINATNDEHIWANTYDKELTDVFAIQTDLAHEIADALKAKLSPSEKAQLERRPTENTEAYLAFMEANELMRRPDKFKPDTLKAEELLQYATTLDPNFATAWAQLGAVQNSIYHFYEPTPARREKAKAAIDRAFALAPDCGDAHLAQAFFYYWCDNDDQHYARALDQLAIAQHSLPNDAEAYMAIGAIQRRQGKWAESTENLEKAVSLDPKNGWIIENLAFNYMANRDYAMAEKTIDKGIEVAPGAFGLRASKAMLAINSRGDFSVAENLLANAPKGPDTDSLITWGRLNVLVMQRKYAEALALVQSQTEDFIHTDDSTPMPKAMVEGNLYTCLKEPAKARAAYEEALPQIEQIVQKAPDDPSRHAKLGFVLAMLGHKDDAIREGTRAIELRPESKDAFDGPMYSIAMAQIYTWTGDKEQALQIIEKSLDTPNGLTASNLTLDPVWDPLREDTRFLAMIEKHRNSVQLASGR
jgi:serine/threonine-protein kinase